MLAISRKTYYKYRYTKDRDYYDYLEIRRIFEEGREMYGYRRIKKAILKRSGWIVNHKKILRIMKKYDIRVRYKDVFKINYTKKSIEENVKPNLLNRDFSATRPNQKWSTDITYIIYNQKKAYLS